MRTKALVASAVSAIVVLGGAAVAASSPALASTASPTTTASSSVAPPAACEADAHWPADIQGRPDGFDGRDDGVYLWHNPEGGWGIRVSHPVLPGRANRVVFSGRIVSQGLIGHVERVRDEKDDRVVVSGDGHSLWFRFVNYSGVDGVDFTTTCTHSLGVNLKVDGSPMPTQFIHLGDRKVSPDANPFRIRRLDV